MAEAGRSLTMLIHGPSKAGKSTLAATAPYPRLLFDAEHGHRFLGLNVKYWDPKTEKPPVADGTWDTCVVSVLSYADIQQAYQYLKLGQHQFKSVIIDSLSEVQVKLIDQLAGTEQMKMQQWGELLRAFSDLLRGIRDLTMHPTQPLEAVALVAMSKEVNGKYKPYLQGSLQHIVSYFWDVVGFLRVEEWPNADPTQPAHKIRRLYVEATDFADAGERVQGRLGSVVEQGDLSIERMLDMIYGAPAPVAAAAAPSE